MRITFVLPHAGLAGGIRVASIYAQALHDRGHQVQVVSLPRKAPTLKHKLKSLVGGKGWPDDPGPEPGHFDRTSVPHRVLETHRPVEARDVPDADLVIATWWETAEWVAKMPPGKGKKVYFIQHDERFVNQPARRVADTWKLPFYRITIAQWLVDLGLQEYGVNQVDLVPNGVDLAQFSAPSRGKQKWPTVGLMYATSHFKGVDIATEAIRMCERTVSGLRVVAFGQKEPIEDLPLPADTQFFRQPAQDKIKDIYASCDAWLFASRSEGYGLPILEAMACRTPVIGTPAGAAPELIREGGGILVKPQDPIDMARAIERISRMNASEWKALSDAAHQTAQQHGWAHATDLFEQALFRAAQQESNT